MKESYPILLLKYALYIAFIAGVILSVTMPIFIDDWLWTMISGNHSTSEYRDFLQIFLVVLSIPCLWIVIEMIQMMNTIKTGPFIIRNTKALNRIGFIFFILSSAFIIKCFLFITIMTVVMAIMLFTIGLFSFTLSALIKVAIVFREENDLTI